ncbi:Kinesin motor domain [Popillia japonica]|uniref:Kinesin motor domain n=1 Tax=Popillia japonica TaxID=7064 RepID=A0AAW1MHE5_POPJA
MAEYELACKQYDCACFPFSDEETDIESPGLMKISCRIENLGMDGKSGCLKLASYKSLYISSSEDNSDDSEAFPVLENVVDGFNAFILIYGTKNTGKETVLFGTAGNPGLIPKSVQTLCNSIQYTQAKRFNIVPDEMNSFKVLNDKQAQLARDAEQKRKVKASRLRKQVPMYKLSFLNVGMYTDVDDAYIYSIFFSYVYIYKNIIYDLLDETGKLMGGKVLKSDQAGNVYIGDVLEVEIRTPSDAYELLSIGQRLKQVYQGIIGDDFANGHSIYNIKVVHLKKGSRDVTSLKCGHLSVVDVHGWEKSNPDSNVDENLQEIISLQDCLKIAKNNYRNHENHTYPHYENNLASLLSSYFKRYRQTKILLCMNPVVQTYEELSVTLGFADTQTETKPNQDLRQIKLKPTWPIIYNDERVPAQNIVLQNTKSPENINSEPSGTIVQKDFKNVIASNEMIRKLLEALHTRTGVLNSIDSEPLKNSFRSHLIALRKQNVRKKERSREKRLMKKPRSVVSTTNRHEESNSFQKPTIYSFYTPLQEHLSRLQKMLDWKINIEIQNQRVILANFKLAEKLTVAHIRSIMNNSDITDVQTKIQQSLEDLADKRQKKTSSVSSETKSKKKRGKKRPYP